MKDKEDYICTMCNLLITEDERKFNNGTCYCGGELIKEKHQIL